MTTFVVLLRGVNVGGRNRLPMADFRAALDAAGLANVRTYIQSGNAVLESAGRAPAVEAAVRAVLADAFGLDVPVIVLAAKELAAIAAANPFPDEDDPKRLHAIVLPAPLAPDGITAAAEREAAVRAKGSRDRVVVDGRTAYLHTPDGFGRSELAGLLTAGAKAPLAAGTARNWSTVAALLDLCSH